MTWSDAIAEDTRRYIVVINHEEQYSIWFDGRSIPDGWRASGFAGTRAECLAHIDEVWTDMRPLSVRTTSIGPR
jgi:MbtH protein